MPKQDKTDVVDVVPEASDANDAAITEATEAPEAVKFTASYGGVDYELEAGNDGWPMDASIAFAEILDTEPTNIGGLKLAKPMSVFLAAILGPAGWAKFRGTKPTVKDMRGMHDAVIKVIFGAPTGE